MKNFCLTSVLFLLASIVEAQNSFKAAIKDKEGNSVVAATIHIKETKKNRTANDSGYVVFDDLPIGTYHFLITAVGFQSQSLTFSLPDTSLHLVTLQREEKALEEVTIISTTRSDQRIENSPLKVEVLGKEEMDEENTIKPANIASLLSDVSGIQIQQSSAVSGNANVRIQGLEGRYTQILRDGMPLFEGFSGGFGVLTIPPLDLRQIELVKGSASTLYGGGAIGGLINLISKRPTVKQEGILTLNQSTLKESNINTFLSKRNSKFGYTLFAGYTHQGATDVNRDELSDVAKLQAVIVHPRLYFYPSKSTTIITGYTGTFEKRKGGDMHVLKGNLNNLHQFFEGNDTKRNTAELIIEHNHPHRIRSTFKGSVSSFDRDITTNTHFFRGNQTAYFTEASVFVPAEKIDWVGGFNVSGDRFQRSKKSGPIPIDHFSNNTIGAFAQATAHLPHNSLLEAGLRTDHHVDYGTFVLPRLAFFHRFSDAWATRLGFGMGYKTPNALAPQNVEYDIEKILPIEHGTKAETSYGINAEVNYKITWGEDNSLFINQALFLTQLQNPILALVLPNEQVAFANASKPVISKGSDTYIQADLNGWELYAGYTFTIAERNYLAQNKFVPLTPKHRFAFTLVKEIENAWRLGLEGSYTGKQHRDADSNSPGYLFAAAMLERKFGSHVSLVLNGENLFDYRQSKHEALFTGSISDPKFKPLWAPIDGRILNLSLRLKL